MNKEQIKGTAKNVFGKVQERAGEMIGSKEQQIKGLQNQTSGKNEKYLGDGKEAIQDLSKRPLTNKESNRV